MTAPIARTATPAPATALHWATGGLLALGLLAATQTRAQDDATNDDALIECHGYNTYGDLGLPADFDRLPYVNPDAPRGGEISIWAQGTFDNMNPYATKEGTPGRLSSLPYERIVQGSAEELSSFYCFLCTTMEYPEDRSFVIFNLRPDLAFSDGTPATAQDIVFSHNLLIEQGTASFASVVGEMITDVEALDDHTVKFTFGEGFSAADTISQAGATPLFSQAWYEETGARLDESRFETSPGTGPYMIDRVDQGRSIVYTRNPDYWGDDIPMNVGRNNFDAIRVEYFADTTAAFEAFKAGAFTFRLENSSLTWATGYDFPALEDGYVVREELPDGTLPAATGFLFNMTQDKFADPRVRQAIALMYNFTWTNDTLQYGLFQQRESFWEGSDLQATGTPEGRELEYLEMVADLIDPALLTDEVTVPHTSGDRQLDRDNLRAALDLLAEAGYVAGDDGMLRRDGQPLDLEFLSQSPTFDRIVLPYIDNLKRLGIDARYNRVDPAQYTERTNTFDFDMIYDGYNTFPEEGESLGQRFGSDGVGDIFNPASYSNPAVDRLIEEVVLATDATNYDDMTAAVRAIDRIMRRDLYVVPVWYNPVYWVAYYDMYRHPEIPAYDLGYLDFWWYDADAAEALRDVGALR